MSIQDVCLSVCLSVLLSQLSQPLQLLNQLVRLCWLCLTSRTGEVPVSSAQSRGHRLLWEMGLSLERTLTDNTCQRWDFPTRALLWV